MVLVDRWRGVGWHDDAEGDADKCIMMLGLSASGRTTALRRLHTGRFVQTKPSVGFNVATLHFNHPKLGKTAVTAWDMGRGGRVGPDWIHYYEGTGGIVYFIDSTDSRHIGEACEDLQLVLRDHPFDGAPLLVLANKQDLPNAMSVEEVERWLRLSSITGRDVKCMPTVASTGKGLWEAMYWITEAVDDYLKSPTRSSMAWTVYNAKLHSLEQEQLPVLPDDDFLKAVEECTLPSWDYRTNLRLAWLYLSRHGHREGTRRIFEVSKAFIANSPVTQPGASHETTFHATLTYTWAHLVDYAITSTSPEACTGTFEAFLLRNPHLENFCLPLHYYTEELLDSPHTHDEVVLPDRRPLPSIVTLVRPLKARSLSARSTPQPLTDAQFLEAVRDRTLNGWGHAAMLRVVWACLRLHGVRKGADMTTHLLRSFQGRGFHATITTFWCQVLSGLMVHGWPTAVAQLDTAATVREALQDILSKDVAADGQQQPAAAGQEAGQKVAMEAQPDRAAASQEAGHKATEAQPDTATASQEAAQKVAMEAQPDRAAASQEAGQKVATEAQPDRATASQEAAQKVASDTQQLTTPLPERDPSFASTHPLEQSPHQGKPEQPASPPQEPHIVLYPPAVAGDEKGSGEEDVSSDEFDVELPLPPEFGNSDQGPGGKAMAGPGSGSHAHLRQDTESQPAVPAPDAALQPAVPAPDAVHEMPRQAVRGCEGRESAEITEVVCAVEIVAGTKAGSAACKRVSPASTLAGDQALTAQTGGLASVGEEVQPGRQVQAISTTGSTAGNARDAGDTGTGSSDSQPVKRGVNSLVTESALPGATALIPTLPELLMGNGHASELAKQMILDQHMYLVHYSKQLIYSDGAAAAFVMPDKKPLPS